MKLYVLFEKMRSQFYKYPLAIKLNIPLMPIFMVLSTHPLGATSNSSPRLQKKEIDKWQHALALWFLSCDEFLSHNLYFSFKNISNENFLSEKDEV